MSFNPSDFQIRFLRAIERFQVPPGVAIEGTPTPEGNGCVLRENHVPEALVRAEIWPWYKQFHDEVEILRQRRLIDRNRGLLHTFDLVFSTMYAICPGVPVAYRNCHGARIELREIFGTESRVRLIDVRVAGQRISLAVAEAPQHFYRLTPQGFSVLDEQLAAHGEGGKAGDVHAPTSSDDFTSVDWYGRRYEFAKGNQAQAVRVLWKAWEDGGHSLTQETIRDRIGSAADQFQLSKTFRTRKPDGGYEQHPAWGTMIQEASKGCYKLVPPESP